MEKTSPGYYRPLPLCSALNRGLIKRLLNGNQKRRRLVSDGALPGLDVVCASRDICPGIPTSTARSASHECRLFKASKSLAVMLATLPSLVAIE